MTTRHHKSKRSLSVENRILGNETFAAITAVEGIALGSASRARLASLRERRLSPSEQRAEVIRAYLESK
jgi:hypothetical protein